MEQTPQNIGSVKTADIVFDCPFCNKSMAIDPRGAGMMISCPDCGQKVQVPGMPNADTAAMNALAASNEAPEVRIQLLTEALEASQAKVERLVANLEEVRDRRKYLEKLRSDNMARFDQIGKELVTIQNAFDRIVAILQDAAAEKPEP